jgi:beta-glucosidase-like glycosyl hydrolase
MKKIIISSTAVLSVVVLAGCGGGDLSQEAQNDATKQVENAQVAVQETNQAYVESKDAVKNIRQDAAQEIKDSTKATLKDAAKDIANVTQDQIKQDAAALQQVAVAAGAKYTVAILEGYKTKAAKSVSPTAEAVSIENSSKNGASFVVEVVETNGTSTQVYLDATGDILVTN